MERRRHTLALGLWLLAAGAPLFAGCFGSHMDGRDPEPEPPSRPPVLSDGGAGAADAGPSDPPPRPRPVEPSCRGETEASWLRVELEQVGLRACEYGELEGAAVYEVAPRPDVDGIVIRFDACPFADDDCRCDAVVHGVGVDALPPPHDDSRLPRGTQRIAVAPTAIVVQAPPCDVSCMEPCACVAPLYFAAVDGSLEDPPVAAEQVTASWGDELCRVSDGECDQVFSALEVITWSSGFPGAIGTGQPLEQGQTIPSEGEALMLRGLRTTHPDCGGDLPRSAAWAAWRI